MKNNVFGKMWIFLTTDKIKTSFPKFYALFSPGCKILVTEMTGSLVFREMMTNIGKSVL